MKILHCADLHLDSKMSANLSPGKRKERKAEILHTYQRMIRYAAENSIHAIVIAGDLFDTNTVSKTAANAVYNSICNNPEIEFFYLRGNHDAGSFLASMEEVPGNLHFFEEEWTDYALNKAETVWLHGAELNAKNNGQIYNALSLDARKFHIVTLHGQDAVYQSKEKAEVIALSLLKNKGIDYLALGHVHKPGIYELDNRGKYCYPGCLEGRGFDECGTHGFVVLDIDEEALTYTHTFVPFASRTLYALPVDVSVCGNSDEIIACIERALDKENYDKGSLVKLVLTGEVDVECEKNLPYILSRFEEDFYFVKIKDETTLKVDYRMYEHDVTLKGEFIRTVMAARDLDEETKNEIIRCGLLALSGEDIAE